MAAVGLAASNSGATLLAMALCRPAPAACGCGSCSSGGAAKSGRTCSAYMAFISRGTPGISAAQRPCSSSNQGRGGAVVVDELVALGRAHGLLAVVLRRAAIRAGEKVRVSFATLSRQMPMYRRRPRPPSPWSGRPRWGQARRKNQQVAAAFACKTSSFSRAGLSPMTCWCSTLMPSSASSRL